MEVLNQFGDIGAPAMRLIAGRGDGGLALATRIEGDHMVRRLKAAICGAQIQAGMVQPGTKTNVCAAGGPASK